MPRTPADAALLAVARLVLDVSVRAADDLGGLSPVQLRALTALREAGSANLVSLAGEMGVTVSTASRLVDRLVTADWVHRRASSQDRRELALTLTRDGTALLRRYDARRLARLRQCLDRLDPERQEVVVAALGELAAVAHS
jgi:DNA-binding MarR family transcriptional regulator